MLTSCLPHLRCAFASRPTPSVATAAFVLLLSGAQPSYGQDPKDAIREAVAAQALTDRSLASTAKVTPVDRNGVTLEVIPSYRLTVFRASIRAAHSPAYLVALHGQEVVRLGGFQAPDLFRASQLMGGSDTWSAESALRRAEVLARLADPYGAEAVVLGKQDSSDGAAPVYRAWINRRLRSWPGDTVARVSAERTLILLTVLSRNLRSYERAWTPLAYSFAFGANGELLAWSRSKGEAFGVPE